MLTPPASLTGAPTCFNPTKHDRFSSHAPFHFDLSILDIYVSLKHGATLVLVEEQLGKEPARLAPWIAEKKTHRLVLGSIDLEPAGAVRKTGTARLFFAQTCVVRRRGVSDQIPETIEVFVAASSLLQLVRSNGDQRMHVL